MYDKFMICGDRIHIRTDEEMLTIDKAIAEEAFKKYRVILEDYLKLQGFLKYKSSAYVRRSVLDLLEYIDLQKERYGSKTFTVNYSLMPLYVPHDCIITGFGGRLGELIRSKDVWWDYATYDAAETSFQNVSRAIELFLLPWFKRYSDEAYLRKTLKKEKRHSRWTGKGISYKNEEWLNAMDDRINKIEVIDGNIQKLKLPKALKHYSDRCEISI
ncbi:MAG: DUF4304 domain-containing protein [Acetatifactor sp.]|nr:DUF4304 domain-containing protein [Acetatifactor sp.]